MTAKSTYDPARTGLLFVDPYNDFLSESGKLSPMVKEAAEQVRLIDNLKAVAVRFRTQRPDDCIRRVPAGARWGRHTGEDAGDGAV